MKIEKLTIPSKMHLTQSEADIIIYNNLKISREIFAEAIANMSCYYKRAPKMALVLIKEIYQ